MATVNFPALQHDCHVLAQIYPDEVIPSVVTDHPLCFCSFVSKVLGSSPPTSMSTHDFIVYWQFGGFHCVVAFFCCCWLPPQCLDLQRERRSWAGAECDLSPLLVTPKMCRKEGIRFSRSSQLLCSQSELRDSKSVACTDHWFWLHQAQNPLSELPGRSRTRRTRLSHPAKGTEELHNPPFPMKQEFCLLPKVDKCNTGFPQSALNLLRKVKQSTVTTSLLSS